MNNIFPKSSSSWVACVVIALVNFGPGSSVASIVSGIGFVSESEYERQLVSVVRTAFAARVPNFGATGLRHYTDLATMLRDAGSPLHIASWATNDPASLAGYATLLPESPQRSHAQAEALKSWVSTYEQAAADWLLGQPPSGEMDTGILSLANRPDLAEHSPREAVKWAELLFDANLRDDAVSRAVMQWAATDRKAAREYIEESDCPSFKKRRGLVALFDGK